MYCALRIVRLLVAIVLIASCRLASAADWEVDLVYDGGFAQGDSSLALDSTGLPHISYTANGTLFLASPQIGGWSSEIVTVTGFWGGGWSSLDFGPGGQPGIAFIEASATNLLKFAYRSGGVWQFETVDDVGWQADYISLAFNSSGQACIAYCKNAGAIPEVWFARRIGMNNWNKQRIMQVGALTGPALAIEGSRAYVTFTENASGKLKLAMSEASGPWQVRDIDGGASNPAIWYTACAPAPGGKLAIAYFLDGPTYVELKYACGDGYSWRTESAALLARESICHCTLVVDSEGMPFIGYYDTETSTFKNAWKSGGRWLTETIDPAPGTGIRPDYAIDGLGNLLASYFDSGNGFVKFAVATAPRSIRSAKMLPDGQTVQISGSVASVASNEMGTILYMQEADRSCGIQLRLSSSMPPIARGGILDVSGQLTTVGGERVIDNALVEQMGMGPEPEPLGMTSRALGGADFGTPPAGQRGVVGGSGLNNIGLLVRMAGRVVEHEPTGPLMTPSWFSIEDGASFLDPPTYEPGFIKVRVLCPAGASPPTVGSYVAVTGISSCYEQDGKLYPMIRPRSQEDIVVHRYVLHGLNFSPYMDGQEPPDFISEEQLRLRMGIIVHHTEWIRTFGCVSGLEKSGLVAHELGMKAAIGAWLGTENTPEEIASNEEQIANLIAIASAGQADIAVVGSEVLQFNRLPESRLIYYINRVKQAMPSIPVTTGETWWSLLSHPAVISACDIVMPNYYPYWEGVPIEQAISWLEARHQQIIAAAGGKPVIISETGWPSAGNTVGQAVPSPENAAFYFNGFVSWARANDVRYFYFEAFDESWKAAYEGPQGAHWGVWDKNGVLKPGMGAAFGW